MTNIANMPGSFVGSKRTRSSGSLTVGALRKAAERLSHFARPATLQFDTNLAYTLRLDKLGYLLGMHIPSEDDKKVLTNLEIEAIFDEILITGRIEVSDLEAFAEAEAAAQKVAVEGETVDLDESSFTKDMTWCKMLPKQEIEPTVPSPGHKLVACDLMTPGQLGGSVIMLGKTGAGKSEHVKKNYGFAVTIRWGEPYEMYDIGGSTIQVERLSQVIGATLIMAAAGELIFVDSLSFLLYNLSGTGLTGGVISTSVTALTGFNNLIARVGGMAIISVNVMIPDEAMTAFARELGGKVGGVVLLERDTIASSTFRTRTRRVFGPKNTDGEPTPAVRLAKQGALPDDRGLSEFVISGLGTGIEDVPNKVRYAPTLNLDSNEE